jgi:hypothetical protein
VAASSSAVDGHRLLAGRRTLQSVADPALLRLAGEARIGPVDATGLNVVVSLVRARLDLDAAYANRRRAEEAQALGCLRVGNVNEPDLRVDPELAGDALDERGRLRVVRAPVEVEDLDQRPGSSDHSYVCPERGDGEPERLVEGDRLAVLDDLRGADLAAGRDQALVERRRHGAHVPKDELVPAHLHRDAVPASVEKGITTA